MSTGTVAVEQGADRALRRLVRAVPLIATAWRADAEDGIEAVVTLDPAFVRARAEQQALTDLSIDAAAGDPRVQRMIRDVAATINEDMGRGERLVRCRVAEPSGRTIVAFALAP